MEHQNLAPTSVPRHCKWLLLAAVSLLMGSQAMLYSQKGALGTPYHVLVFKVNEQCDDTVALWHNSPNHFALKQLSKTPCALTMGFGENFYCKGLTTLIDGNSVSLMLGVHHDKIFKIQAAEQTVVTPYGTMRVSNRENVKLFGKWQTYTFHLKPTAVNAGTTILRFNTTLGVIGIEEINNRCELIGKVQILAVDGMSLRQFANQDKGQE